VNELQAQLTCSPPAKEDDHGKGKGREKKDKKKKHGGEDERN